MQCYGRSHIVVQVGNFLHFYFFWISSVNNKVIILQTTDFCKMGAQIRAQNWPKISVGLNMKVTKWKKQESLVIELLILIKKIINSYMKKSNSADILGYNV